jgi:hypothetical protein
VRDEFSDEWIVISASGSAISIESSYLPSEAASGAFQTFTAGEPL